MIRIHCFCLIALFLSAPAQLLAQSQEGFTYKVPAATQGQERTRQESLWVMEVDLKPLRIIWVDIKDPETGETAPELFYYLCYRAINRPLESPSVNATVPVNPTDPEPGPAMFIPEITLIAEDSDDQQVFVDQIVPQAQAAIIKKERRKFKNSVTLTGPLPAATKDDPNNENALYGVAIFRGVSPEFDRFTVLMSGFSNGYMVEQGPDGEPLLMRKTIRQRVWRPGDEFDADSSEFRFDSDPAWIYRPDAPEPAKTE